MKKNLILFIIDFLYALWWGGFTFYAAIVVPEGMKILGDHKKMGLITQSVTNYLNGIGVVVLFTSYIVLTSCNQKKKPVLRSISWDWFVLAFLQSLLFYIHHLLANSIQLICSNKTLEHSFYIIHRFYLLASTAMWLLIPKNYYRVNLLLNTEI